MNQVDRDLSEIILNETLFLPFSGKKILVTGATGLIGSMLVKSVLEASEKYGLNIKVYGQIRNSEKARSIFGSLFEKAEFSFSPEISCDYIVHTVSPTASRFFIEHPVETIRTSVESTMETLEAAKQNNASVVYLSSMEQYGVPYMSGQKMTENQVGIIDHLNVRSSYSESKRLCECLCVSYAKEYDVDVKIVRLAQTFGAGVSVMDNRMPMQFAKAAAKGKDIVLHTEGNSISNFVYLTDAITGILTILHYGKKGEAYNICNDEETRSVRAIAEMVAEKVAGGKIQVKIERNDNMGYAPDVEMYLVSQKLRDLGWKASVSMCEAYKRVLEYIKETNQE